MIIASEGAMNEQEVVVHTMERLYAKMHRLRDVVQGNNWGEDLDIAWTEMKAEIIHFETALAHLT
jgi:hypothetical protein